MTTTITVDGCDGCPLAEIGANESLCRAVAPPENAIWLYLARQPPKWCPLRTSDRLITLRTK